VFEIISNSTPLFDIIYKRPLMFVKKCLTGSSDPVEYVARQDVYHGSMTSILGRNVVFGNEQFSSVCG